jgi:hypothetical protein
MRTYTAARRVIFPVCLDEPRQAAVQRDEQVQALLLADLADQDAVRPHPQGLLDQAAQLDLAGALQVGLAGLHGDDVRQAQLQYHCTVRTHLLEGS